MSKIKGLGDWFHSHWLEALGFVPPIYRALRRKGPITVKIEGIHRVTGVPATFTLSADDIPKDVDLISPSVWSMVAAYKFKAIRFYSEGEYLVSIERNNEK